MPPDVGGVVHLAQIRAARMTERGRWHADGHPHAPVPSCRKLWHALREVDNHLRSQSARLVNYAKRYRTGLRVGTSVTEGTANFLVNRRMNKAQQMRWSRRGADLLLQVRCAVYNGAFGHGFGNLFEPTSNTVRQSLLAA
jgi:hypothetical protein